MLVNVSDATGQGLLSRAIRGAIKTSVETSTPDLVGGQDFTIFVTVSNPFEVPIALSRVSTNLPAEFIDLDRLDQERQAARLLHAKTHGSERGLGRFADALLSSVTTISIRLPLMGLTFTAPRRVSAEPAVARETGDLSADRIEAAIAGFDVENSDGDGSAERLGYEPSPTILQPGNSATRTFTMRSKAGLWFRPAAYKLNIEIAYEIEGVPNRDTLRHALQVRAPLGSTLSGAVIGGVIGWFTRNATRTAALVSGDAALNLVVAVVLAFMAVLLLARKRDIQPVVSIEDFWGGITVGFLVSYSGSGLVNQLIGTK